MKGVQEVSLDVHERAEFCSWVTGTRWGAAVLQPKRGTLPQEGAM